MPKISLSDALLEKEESDSVTCKTCSAPATEEFAPHCMSCGLYWQDCDNGLWDDEERDPRDDCDCLDADLDILTGIERCHVCGRSRFLNSEEFTRRLKQEAEWAEAYHEEMEAE
jgi:hypothetical protein